MYTNMWLGLGLGLGLECHKFPFDFTVANRRLAHFCAFLGGSAGMSRISLKVEPEPCPSLVREDRCFAAFGAAQCPFYGIFWPDAP